MLVFRCETRNPSLEHPWIGVGMIEAMGRYEAATVALRHHSQPVGWHVFVRNSEDDSHWEFVCKSITDDGTPFIERVTDDGAFS